MMKYLVYILIAAAAILSSCDTKEDFEQIDSKVVEVAGEWWIKFTYNGNETGYYNFLTMNTSADLSNIMWITDEGSWKGIKFKCPVNLSGKTFSGSNLEDIASDNVVTISNGKIVINGGKSTTGRDTDLITFDIELSSEPGVVYKAEGTRRTGFVEDDH